MATTSTKRSYVKKEKHRWRQERVLEWATKRKWKVRWKLKQWRRVVGLLSHQTDGSSEYS